MLLKRAEDYRFVMPDADAMEGGAHPFSGDIYPRRADVRKNILSYEDICFLQEACGELFAALMYFNNIAPSYFPFGTTYHRPDGDPVPRALLGAAVGRFSDSYGSATFGPYYLREFMNHYPGGYGQYIEKFMLGVGRDVRRLFTDNMVCSPQTGRTLEDLKGYDVADLGTGYYIPTDGTGFFDVFYTLVTMASSLEPLKATADPKSFPDGVPASFGSAYVGAVMKKYGQTTWGSEFWSAFEELAYHDGLQFFTYDSGGLVGRVAPVFVDASFTLSASSDVVMETSAESNGAYPPQPGVVTFSAGGKVFTSAELSEEGRTDPEVLDHDPRSLQLAYGALEASLGMKLSEMSMGVVRLSPEVDMTKTSQSMELSQEMLAPLWALPGMCRRIFIPRMRMYYLLRYGNYAGFSGRRITERENGAVRSDSGPVEETDGWADTFPGFYFSKEIRGVVSLSVSPDEEIYESHRSSSTNVWATDFHSGPKDPSVSPYYDAGIGQGGGEWESALNGILKDVDATVFATVYHYDAAWVNLNGTWQTVRFESVTNTFPIRYRLVPRFDGDKILWTPSKTEAEMVNEALGRMGFDRDSVYSESYLTETSPLPDPSTDERLPDITVAPGEYGESHFAERVEVRFGYPEAKSNDGFWFSGDSVHYGFAGIAPRTADQT